MQYFAGSQEEKRYNLIETSDSYNNKSQGSKSLLYAGAAVLLVCCIAMTLNT